MKTLILDYSKWRCGGNNAENSLGVGCTYLLNKEGFMCCLGQFTPQLNESVELGAMLEYGEPCEMRLKIENLSECCDESFISTDLTVEAVEINDAGNTTPQEKIKLLTELFQQYGYEIEVINNPPAQ